MTGLLRTSSTSRRNRRRSGRMVGGGLILLPLLGVGIGMLMYFRPTGEKGTSYIEETIGARDVARVRAAEMELHGLHKELQMHAITNDGRYPTKKQLLQYSGITRKLFGSHGEEGPLCIYIDGQGDRDPPDNVLVYEVDVPEGETGLVLLRGGQVVSYSAEQIAAAVGRTEAYLARRR